ncbi:oxidoreductase [Labrenzia sp. VG12]|nr:oxidoreductase [Labrenzia sp. VG12]
MRGAIPAASVAARSNIVFSTIPLPLFAPVLLVIAAGLLGGLNLRRFTILPWLSEGAALAALGLAALGVGQLIQVGPIQVIWFEGPLALALRLDAVSATMSLLVAFVGWIVMRFSRTYLARDRKEGAFHAQMLVTLAAVQLLVLSGSFVVLLPAFIAVGITLRKLLLFYPDRPQARRAAAKFSLVWHAGDIALLLAALLFALATGTGVFSQLSGSTGSHLEALPHGAVALVVLAAVLKTASFPLHGWLTEVMEAPTPVSALLHAGIINAGGLLLIRLADLVQASPGAMAFLVMIGGFTALFGAVVMLTQSAVKTALAWSTVSQMGFMLLQCGLGLWPLALLHIVAHSLYKAHAFLSSTGAVGTVAKQRRPGEIAVPNLAAVAKSFALSLVLYGIVSTAFVWLAGPKSAQALALGAILIFGVAYLVAQGLADAAPAALTRRTGLAATGVALAYFAFQQVANTLWVTALPATPEVGPLEWALLVLAVASFGLVALAQTLFPLWAHHPASAGLRVHVANGFYLNALLDRLTGGYRIAK